MKRNPVTTGVKIATAILSASLCAAGVPAAAATSAAGTNNNTVSRPLPENISPLANTAAASARVISPDGTSLFQPITPFSPGPPETRWFTFEAEPGKTYVVDILDPYGDLGLNAIGSVSVTDSGGVSAPPEANSNCSAGATNRAPGLEVAGDGWRCIIRTWTPGVDGAGPWNQNKRGIFVGVGSGGGNSFQIRVREATIYGRWTTNGYDFHVELQNTTADSMCAEIVFNPQTGYTWNGATWSVPAAINSTTLTVPAMGAIKTIIPAFTTSGGQLRGTMRVTDCGTGQLVPGGLNVSSYGFNGSIPPQNIPGYLYFFPTNANHGGQNSW